MNAVTFKSQSNRPGSRAPQGTSIAQPAVTGDVLTRPDEAAVPLLLAADDRRRSLYGYDTANIGSALTFVPYGLHGLA
jgi:hypothetical protein